MRQVRLDENGRAELWRRWGAGATLTEISRGLGCSIPAVYHKLRQRGGFAPPADIEFRN